MNAKLNFYDIYCFLIPGVVLLGLLWIPFGVANVQIPLAPSASAVLFVFFGFAAGLVLDNFATTTFVNEVVVEVGNGKPIERQRSERMLDDLAPELTSAVRWFVKDKNFKERLREKILNLHAIDVEPLSAEEQKRLKELEGKAKSEQINDKEKDEQACLKRREDFITNRITAFFHCRNTLVQNDAAVYAEQKHGMYALWRSLTATWLFTSAYHIGVGLGAVLNFPLLNLFGVTFSNEVQLVAAIVLILVPAIVLLSVLFGYLLTTWLKRTEWKLWRLRRWIFAGLVLGACCGHPQIGIGAKIGTYWYVFLALGSFLMFLVHRSSIAYLRFCDQFATQVYLDFVVLLDTKPEIATQKSVISKK